METPALHGDRLDIVPLRPEQAEPLRVLRREPEVARWWGPPRDGWPLTPAYAHHRVSLGTSIDNGRARAR